MANQQNYGKIAENFFSSLRYSPFPPKVDFDDVNIPSLWTKSCCVTKASEQYFSAVLVVQLFKLWKVETKFCHVTSLAFF